ncbi:small integral membrane protein 14-like [Artemia franciscana]|uniref:small integral membrane protein 14-like n=1 Tax=Artemia franciscana TaxID=6661 RepID=UPI0032DB173E
MDPSGGPGGYDPCECVWSHEMAMRRLINMLRDSQSACTDTECFDSLPLQRPPSETSDTGFMGIICVWLLLALALFFARPRRQPEQQKESDDTQGNGPSPPPPPMVN